MSALLGGIEIRTSPWLPETSDVKEAHSDWRERLHRNLSRPSTGKWEPLTVTVRKPVAFLIGNGMWLHPNRAAALYLDAAPSHD